MSNYIFFSKGRDDIGAWSRAELVLIESMAGLWPQNFILKSNKSRVTS